MTNTNIYYNIHTNSHQLGFDYFPGSSLDILRTAIHYYAGSKLYAATNQADSAYMMRLYKNFITEYVKFLATVPVTPILSKYSDCFCEH